MNQIQEELINCLPHGSGIDCNWESSVTRNYLNFHNSFQAMNDSGFYVGYADFTVKLPLVDKCVIWNEFDIEFNGHNSRYIAARYDLYDYLIDIVYDSLHDFFNHIN
jgi:hypothetical protein